MLRSLISALVALNCMEYASFIKKLVAAGIGHLIISSHVISQDVDTLRALHVAALRTKKRKDIPAELSLSFSRAESASHKP